jgi:uncharacterized glyoxalase superfamily protein PhnB
MLKRSIPVLRVRSSVPAREFYCGKLGFEVEFEAADPNRPDPAYLGVVRGGAVLHLSSHAGDGTFGAVAYVHVDDVDALFAELRARGVAVDLSPTDQTWGMREMYVKDGDGNTIRFGAPIAR